MRFEKINENKVKIELTKDDLMQHNIKLTDIAFGTDISRKILHDIMIRAFDELEFEPDNLPLVIEAVPTSSFSINIFITKMRTEEEFEENVEKVAKQNERNLQGLNLLEKFTNDFEKMTKNVLGSNIQNSEEKFENIYSDSDGDLVDLVDELEELEQENFESWENINVGKIKRNKSKSNIIKKNSNLSIANERESIGNISKSNGNSKKNKNKNSNVLENIEIIYKFENLDDVIDLSHIIFDLYKFKSKLYKYEDVYYTVFDIKTTTKEEIVKLRLVVDEFGNFVSTHKVAKGFLAEHGAIIVKSDIFKKLNKVAN